MFQFVDVSNQRLQMVEGGSQGSTTLYVSEGRQIFAEYNGVGSGMAWMKSYVYLGGRLFGAACATLDIPRPNAA